MWGFGPFFLRGDRAGGAKDLYRLSTHLLETKDLSEAAATEPLL
ncbi:MAG: hypothetical protein WBA10_18810 [Elainellaceae cyanobacterium]